MVYRITCDYITRAAFNNLFHKFLLLGTIIFDELVAVFQVTLNYERLVAVTFYYVGAYSWSQCMMVKEIYVLAVTRSLH